MYKLKFLFFLFEKEIIEKYLKIILFFYNEDTQAIIFYFLINIIQLKESL